MDAQGNSFDMTEHNKLESLLGSLQVRYKNFHLQFIADEYGVDSADGFADQITLVKDNTLHNQFSTYALQLGYAHNVNDKIKIDASFNFSHQAPWKRSKLYTDEREDVVKEFIEVEHYTFDLKSTFSSDDGHYLVIGNSFQFQNTQHKVSNFTGELPLFGDYTLYGEAVYKIAWVNILGGLRFDWYTEYGVNVSPRIGLTKQIDKFHYKVLYSEAFHTPTGGNYQLNADYNQNNSLGVVIEQAVPEKTHTYEIELGYQFQRNLDMSVNVFYTEIQNYFLYSFDENFDDYYNNAGELSTWGLEAVLNYQHALWGKLKFNYSFYQSLSDVTTDFKALDSEGNVIHAESNIGFPTHKLTANHNFKITDSLSFNHTVIFSSERYGYNGPKLERHKPIWIYNTYLRYQNAIWEGLEVGLGLYDVFNGQYQYVQSFNGSHPALPGNTREVRLKLSYQF